MLLGNIDIGGIAYPVKIIKRKKQSRGVSASGEVKIGSFSAEETFISIKINEKNEAVAQEILNFIRLAADYSQNIFAITPDANVNLENGPGTAVNVRFWSDNLEKIKKHDNLCEFEFVFRVEY